MCGDKMRNMIVGSNDKLLIESFKNCQWNKLKNKNDYVNTKLYCLLAEDEEYYFCEVEEYVLIGCLANIGKNPHPFIGFSEYSVWYNSNIGGIYIVGYDKKTDAFFAPVCN